MAEGGAIEGGADFEGAGVEGLSAGVEVTGGMLTEGDFVEFAGSAGRRVSLGGGAEVLVEAVGVGCDDAGPGANEVDCVAESAFGDVEPFAPESMLAASPPPL